MDAISLMNAEKHLQELYFVWGKPISNLFQSAAHHGSINLSWLFNQPEQVNQVGNSL